MTDQDFITDAASLLARCSPQQREQLVALAQGFGKPAEGAAMDGARPVALAKTIDEMFPGLKRLRAAA